MSHTVRMTMEKLNVRFRLLQGLTQRHFASLPPFRLKMLEQHNDFFPVEPEFDDSAWEVVQPPAAWGKELGYFVLRSRFQVPPEWENDFPAALWLPLGTTWDFIHPEATVYVDGKFLGSCDREHRQIRLPQELCDGKWHHLTLHGWVGYSKEKDAPPFIRPCGVVQVNPLADQFLALARVGLGTVEVLGEDSPARGRLLDALDAAFHCLDFTGQEPDPLQPGLQDTLRQALDILKHKARQAGTALDVDVYAIGHAHIDVAWLWTYAMTRHKAQRTFSNVLGLMERFSGFHFSQSQPQLYEFVRQDRPELFERIRQKVADGTWEPMGGMWVEADTNLSGAESLARQFLLGKRWFSDTFGEGVDTPVLWLPDVFGFNAALPQLASQAGIHWFFSTKISWNQYNTFPWTSFYWQGLDGTRLLSHFSPTRDPQSSVPSTTYNAMATPRQIYETWHNNCQKDAPDLPVLMSYGWGDGGGGPTSEMLETIDLLGDFAGMPRTRFATVRQFFTALEEKASNLPVWYGELYLEYHRGTYTSQARMKRANRRSEIALHDAEMLCTWAHLLDRDFSYPTADFEETWKKVCLNQFHDVLPGSSIGEVYADALEHHCKVQKTAEKATIKALESLSANLGEEGLAANLTAFPQSGALFIAQGEKPALERESQQVESGWLVDCGELPPLSLTPLSAIPPQTGRPASALRISTKVLENEHLCVEFNAAGDIHRIFDKTNHRDVVPEGMLANQLWAFEDRALLWDAWDVEIHYDDQRWLAEAAETIQVAEAGALRATVEIRRRVRSSWMIQRISLQRGSPRLDFDTWVDWRERHTLLKTIFPLKVFASEAVYEIPWGHVRRPTHRNTAWDWARFESPAQKWVDVSEHGYGVALLNDCKYGYDAHLSADGTYTSLGLSLLRSPTYPDRQADQGEHVFRYSLLPHAGGWEESVPAHAAAINDTPRLFLPHKKGAKQEARGIQKLLAVDTAALVVETVKRSEDGLGWILRMYEAFGSRGQATLTLTQPAQNIWRSNLLEERKQRLNAQGVQVQVEYRPFEIITLRLESRE
ncbi:MAG: alpha-mannosidase [Chloroflexi bacterium HGW-Chloroflexi-10]|nr:MAG: alpha-mannosidase [Chloroflexi bacterium HGW-Chloroflexi-10]